MAARRTLSQAIIVASSLLPLNNYRMTKLMSLLLRLVIRWDISRDGQLTSGLFGLLLSNKSKEGKPSIENLGVKKASVNTSMEGRGC